MFLETRTYAIGVEATMDVIGGKWKPIILCNLRHGAMRPRFKTRHYWH